MIGICEVVVGCITKRPVGGSKMYKYPPSSVIFLGKEVKLNRIYICHLGNKGHRWMDDVVLRG